MFKTISIKYNKELTHVCIQSKLPWSNWNEEEFSRKILEGYNPSLDRVKDDFHCIKDLIKELFAK